MVSTFTTNDNVASKYPWTLTRSKDSYRNTYLNDAGRRVIICSSSGTLQAENCLWHGNMQKKWGWWCGIIHNESQSFASRHRHHAEESLLLRAHVSMPSVFEPKASLFAKKYWKLRGDPIFLENRPGVGKPGSKTPNVTVQPCPSTWIQGYSPA